MKLSEVEYAQLMARRGKPVPRPEATTLWKEEFKLEKDFQAWIVAVADRHGWMHYHTHRSDRSEPGFPDLTLVHVQWDQFLMRELKVSARVTSDQQDWIDGLSAVGVDAAVWRPADGREIVARLSRGQERLPGDPEPERTEHTLEYLMDWGNVGNAWLIDRDRSRALEHYRQGYDVRFRVAGDEYWYPWHPRDDER